VIPPGAQGNPGPIPIYRACGHQFQLAQASPVDPCSCGRHSIGNCHDCNRPLCGLHGPGSGLFLCADCRGKRHKQERDKYDRTRAQEAEDWAEWQRAVHSALSGIADPTERLVRFIGHLSADEVENHPARWPRLASETIALLPDLWSSGLKLGEMPWDHDVLQQWFLDAVRTPPVDHRFQRGIFRVKRFVVPGWTFWKGNISQYQPNSSGNMWYNPKNLYNVTVLVDGRRGRIGQGTTDYNPRLGEPHDAEFDEATPSGFNVLALHEMARLAELPDLPVRPASQQPPS
jgi:hypothetical protein